ncbi:hypothetical protein [Streptococcus pluranimalium]|uniref:hypothetical protein n=1 Tax=Streptococcus pluranimalium TaxID=82348 RepID=UPI003F673E09
MFYWNKNKYRNKINKQEFIVHLNEFDNIEEYLFVVKYAEVFTGNLATNDTKNSVQQLLFEKFYSKFPDKVNRFLNDILILNDLYKKLSESREAELSKVRQELLPLYLINSLNFVIETTQTKITAEASDHRDFWIDFVGKQLKILLRNKVEFKYIAVRDTVPDSLLRIFLDHHIFSSTIVDSWVYSELLISQADGKLYFKEIGQFSIGKLYTQAIFLELKESRDFHGSLIHTFSGEEDKDFEHRKEYTYKQIEEYFYTDDFNQEYLGVSLNEWIMGYLTLYKISLMYSEPTLLTEEILLSMYKANLIREESAKIILKNLSFSVSSRDLYDSPLIKFGHEFLLLPKFIESIDFSRSIFSLLSNVQNDFDTQISQKGKNFERHINSLVKYQFDICSSGLKVVEGQETYEIDGLFFDGGTVVVLESKTQKQPENYIDYAKNQLELKSYIQKFHRNADFFINNKDYIIKELKLDTNQEFTFIKVFVTNVSQMKYEIDGVYIIDEIDFSNFMRRRVPGLNIFSNFYKTQKCIELEPELYSGKATVQQFVNLIKNSKKRDRIRAKITTRQLHFMGHQNIEIFVLDDYIKVN